MGERHSGHIGNAIMADVRSEVVQSEENLTDNSSRDSTRKLLTPSKHVIKKRLPPRLPKSDTDVYVNNKTSFKVRSRIYNLTFSTLFLYYERFLSVKKTIDTILYSSVFMPLRDGDGIIVFSIKL